MKTCARAHAHTHTQKRHYRNSYWTGEFWEQSWKRKQNQSDGVLEENCAKQTGQHKKTVFCQMFLCLQEGWQRYGMWKMIVWWIKQPMKKMMKPVTVEPSKTKWLGPQTCILSYIRHFPMYFVAVKTLCSVCVHVQGRHTCACVFALSCKYCVNVNSGFIVIKR